MDEYKKLREAISSSLDYGHLLSIICYSASSSPIIVVTDGSKIIIKNKEEEHY